MQAENLGAQVVAATAFSTTSTPMRVCVCVCVSALHRAMMVPIFFRKTGLSPAKLARHEWISLWAHVHECTHTDVTTAGVHMPARHRWACLWVCAHGHPPMSPPCRRKRGRSPMAHHPLGERARAHAGATTTLANTKWSTPASRGSIPLGDVPALRRHNLVAPPCDRPDDPIDVLTGK